VTRIEVTPAELVALSRRLSALADDLEAGARGAVGAIDAFGSGLGADIAPSAQQIGDAAGAAVQRLVGAYRGLAVVLSDSAGRYVVTDGEQAAIQARAYPAHPTTR
jgi:hypothetical protein